MSAGELADDAVIRIVIAEDQASVRRGAMLLLSMEPDMEVVGQARNGIEAVELALLLRPDIVLMDLHMPLKGGVAATREITKAQPNTQVLVLTTLDDDETVFEAVRAGAHAYLLKDVSEDELLETIRALRRGESRLTPQIARKVMDQFRQLAGATFDHGHPEPGGTGGTGATVGASGAGGLASVRGAGGVGGAASRPISNPNAERLTEKEERLLELITEGMTNRQIAAAMSLAEGTVKNYISRIMEKLHANTRIELALLARRQPRAE